MTKVRTAILLLLATATCQVGVEYALAEQPPAPSVTQPAAAVLPEQVPTAASFSKLRAVLRKATPGAELDDAKAALITLAQSGDSKAAVALGDYFRIGLNAPIDPANAIKFYRIAIAAGDLSRAVKLADLLVASGQDAAEALGLYDQAASAGDLAAKIRLGDGLSNGALGAVDVAGAVQYYEAALAAGESKAAGRLGDLYARGTALGLDPTQAVDYFKTAADAGDKNAALRLGDIYRDGIIVAADPEAAEIWYRKALAAGNSLAFTALANGLIAGTAGKDGAAEGISMLEKGVLEKRPGTVVALANLLIAGKSVPANLPRALDLLTSNSDDIAAQRLLIGIYADGRVKSISRDLSKARVALANLNTASPAVLTTETLAVSAAAARNLDELTAAAAQFFELDAERRPSVAKRVTRINPNVVVTVLQLALAKRGLFAGSTSGQLTAPTIRAFNQLCRDEGIETECRGGPLSPQALTAVSKVL